MIIANRNLLYYGAAACTGIAGILHLVLYPMLLIQYQCYLFLVAGILQPSGLANDRDGEEFNTLLESHTVILIGIWVITRIPDNPITGRGESVNLLHVYFR
jgi:hypothetical protein